MAIEIGNLDELNEKYPEGRGWVVGSFIPESSMLYSKDCEVKWIRHLKGEKKSGGADLSSSVRTLTVLISGKYKLYFPESKKEVTVSRIGDYVIYDGAAHEFEALEDCHLIVVRWPSLSRKK